jgi:CheY-like chemotaxis protein
VLEVLSKLLSPQSPTSFSKKDTTENSTFKTEQKFSSQYCVLLAEDNPVNQMVAIRQLDKLGYRSVLAENGQQVLDLLDQSTYSLILMDCQMPIMDGIKCTKEIRKQEKLLGKKSIPIIAMTANAMSAAIEECFSSGMSDFVSKPVKIETLQRTLQKWMPL